MISIIHPSRGRPQRSWDAIQRWRFAAVNIDHLEVVVSLDFDDPELHAYRELYKGESYTYRVTVNQNRSAVDAVNNGAKRARGQVFIVVSDDTEPLQLWDEKLLRYANEFDWILKTQDGIQPWIITMPVMDRVYYNRTRNIYDPDFEHMFCDTWLTVQADISGRKIVSELMFPHLNDSIKDGVRKRSDATWPRGEKTFINKIRSTPIEDLRKITDVGMKNWIRNKTGTLV